MLKIDQDPTTRTRGLITVFMALKGSSNLALGTPGLALSAPHLHIREKESHTLNCGDSLGGWGVQGSSSHLRPFSSAPC